MMRTLKPSSANAVFLLGLLVSCGDDDGKPDACDDSQAAAITAVITQGDTVSPNAAPISTFPHMVVVRTSSGVLVEAVRIGGVSAALSSATDLEWTAKLSSADLEHNRNGTQADLAVTAKTICMDGYGGALATATVPLGPAPGVTVADLEVEVTYPDTMERAGGASGASGFSECSVPADLSAAALVTVRAAKGSEGARVTLQASTGSFASGKAADVDAATPASIELTLKPTGDRPQAIAYWLPSAAGHALITAFANGDATDEPQTIQVASAPTLHGPSVPLEREQTYSITLRAKGTLDHCSLEEVVTGAAKVVFSEPDLGDVSGQSLIDASRAAGCENTKVFTLNVTFGKDAAEGAEGTLRCYDTFDQEAHFTFTVAENAEDGAGGAN